MTTGGSGALDPFFDELRRRQPDIDIVVLPPDATPDGTPEIDLAAQRAVQEEVEAVLEDLLRRSGLGEGQRTHRWRRTTGRAHRFGATLTQRDLTPEQSIAGLRAVRDVLVDDPAWDARPGPGSGARLVATHDSRDLEVTAHAVPSILVVQVTGAEVVPHRPAPAAEAGVDHDG